MAFSWSNYQQAVFHFIENKFDNLLVEAVAGSGKSTTLLEIARRIKGTVAIVAFNKAIAEELKGKIAKFRVTDANMSGVEAKTIHAAGNSAVVRFAGDQKVKANKVTIDDKKVDKIVAELVAGRPGHEEEARPDLEEFAPFIIAAVKMAKNLAFGVRGGEDIKDIAAWSWMVYHYTLDDKLPEKVEGRLEDKAIPACIAVLRRSNRDTKNIDFADMVYLPLVHDMKIWQYDCVMVDEAQDLNRARILLAERMVRRGGRLVFVGDPRQCIYGFTGAMPDALDYVKKKFKCQTLPLSVCYRCARTIIQYARRVVSHIQAAPNAPEGLVETIGGDAFDAMTLRPTDAILCRVNAPLVTLAFSLIRRGIACKIEGREIGSGLIALVSRWKVKKLDTLKTRLGTYRDREVAKAMAKDDAERADAIADKVETLLVLVERAQSLGMDVDGLKAMIEDMFSDDVSKKGLLTLCSYHRAKGREFPRVFRIDHFKHCPSRFAKKPHQIEAEENLDYVATTRAELELYEVLTEESTLKAEPAKEPVLEAASA